MDTCNTRKLAQCHRTKKPCFVGCKQHKRKTKVRRLQKTTLDTVAQNQKEVLCENMTDSTEPLEDRSGHKDTEPTNGTVCCTDRQWRDYGRQVVINPL